MKIKHQQYIGKVKHAVFPTQKAGRKRVVVSTEENVLASLDLRRGEIFWRHVLGDNDPIDQIDVALGKYVITLSSEGGILRAWNLPDGQMVWETSLAGKETSKSLLLFAPYQNLDRGKILVYSNGYLHAVSTVDGSILWNVELVADSLKVQQLIHSVGTDMVKDDGLIEILDKISHPAAIGDSLSLMEEHAFGLVQHENGKIHLSVKLGQDWNGELLKESIDMDQHRGTAHKVFINNYIRTDKSHGFRALVVMEDHSLLLLQQGEIVWKREDGLASVIGVTTSELPPERKGVSVAKVEDSLLEWLKGHILKLKGTLMLTTPEDVAAIQALRIKSSEKSKMTRDHNGFRKLLIVLTKARKLFALHTGDGRVVWSLLLPSLRESDICKSPSAFNVYQWQVPHHHALDDNPSVLVVGLCGSGESATSVLSFVDTYTGKELESATLEHSVVQVIPLPYTDSTERKLHLVIDANGLTHLYPRTAEAASIFQRVFPNFYWYSADVENSIITGHALRINEGDEFCFGSRDMWSIVLPADAEKIIATTTRKNNEVVHTQGKVMPDRDVIYKYVSKNILFVATVAPKGAGDIGTVTPDESWLVVYLIDTITGRILHRVTHHGTQGPVRAVVSENWVVYHYFNLRAHRYEMSVIELYDESRADNKDVLKLIVGKHNLTSPMSSYSRPEVTAKSQSYFFTHSLKEVAVTLTAKGVTSKQILLGTIGDQILALDKRYLDPRRSINPTQAEKEEGIIPLTDTLPIIPQSYVTHGLNVEGLRGIITVPSKLESTTLMFAHGVDLFFTHLAPSKTYDSLTEDFSYALLLLTIVALVIAIFVTWIMSEKKELRDKWRSKVEKCSALSISKLLHVGSTNLQKQRKNKMNMLIKIHALIELKD
ncbi:hypothetical protein V2J09_003096 [Rumex salicifolius]